MSEERSAMLIIGGERTEALSSAADAVKRVATCSPIPEVAIAALQALRSVSSVDGTTVSNCSFYGSAPASTPPTIPVFGSDWTGSDDD